MRDSSDRALKALPHKIIKINGGVVVKRGVTEVKICGDATTEVIPKILAKASAGATIDEICSLFSTDSRPAIERLVDELIARRLLVWSSPTLNGRESPLDVFFWHFETSQEEVNRNLNNNQILIVGVNNVSRQMATSLRSLGAENFQVWDYPGLRNLRLFDDSGKVKANVLPDHVNLCEDPSETTDLPFDLIVGTSDFGRSPVLRELNKFCLHHNRYFLPVILRNMIGSVGPLVMPRETACFECLLARENSHIEDPETHTAVDEGSFDGQGVVAFHPLMASILADVASFELLKFCTGIPQSRVGVLIELNLLATRLVTRKVLKIPRCSACGSLNTHSSTNPKQSDIPARNQISQ